MSDVDPIQDQPLTENQAQLMLYLDGELSSGERIEFEKRLASDPDLQREYERFRGLMELTDSITLLEPTDHEIRRFWSTFYNRGEWQVGWFLLLAGLAVLGVYGLYEIVQVDWLPWPVKIAVLSAVVGLGLLIGNTVRLRNRTARFDRYRGVLR